MTSSASSYILHEEIVAHPAYAESTSEQVHTREKVLSAITRSHVGVLGSVMIGLTLPVPTWIWQNNKA
ncbi:uncharacterized protein ARMOST_17002 [Armillaria ostoyae]|uniref:Uncharacterized protein n=1 Tax=Armillaria ostoyae TaxID=47428 RepID=A0A284RXR9_ARMOS|nr:uncharacterized protein ARMOST_17002 [Armillaria ostoyae]